jgi:hypothetical protein
VTTEGIAILSGMLVHGAAMFFWAGKLTRAVADLDRRVARIEGLLDRGVVKRW